MTDVHPTGVTQLLPFLRVRLQCPQLEYADSPRALEGGLSSDIFGFRLADPPLDMSGPLVLRMTHDDEETAREAIIQKGVARAGFPAPTVLLRDTSRSLLGRPLVISPLLRGARFTTLLRPASAIGVFRRLPGQLANIMSALHAVASGAIADELAANGWTSSRLDSLGVLSETEWLLEGFAVPELARAAAWLRDNAPRFGPAVVCHGDLHPLNLLFDGHRVVAVLDWELARLADPAFDVARTSMLVRLSPYPMSSVARVVVQPLAARLADSFVRSYGTLRPLDAASLAWHEALHCLRTLTIVDVGGELPADSRLRRTAEVWRPVAPLLRRRFTAITSLAI